jgi:hypothetical protein
VIIVGEEELDVNICLCRSRRNWQTLVAGDSRYCSNQWSVYCCFWFKLVRAVDYHTLYCGKNPGIREAGILSSMLSPLTITPETPTLFVV